MKIKITIIAIFTLIILSLVLVEVTYVKTSLLDISEQSKQIIEQIKQENSNEEIMSSLNATYDYWKKHEYNFCFLYNHKDLLEIGKEVNQAKSYIEKANIDEAYVHMQLLQEDLSELDQIIGFDFCNIF